MKISKNQKDYFKFKINEVKKLEYDQLNFGIKVHKENTIENTIDLVKKAEQLGFTNCWITEDCFFPGAFSIATACTIHTKRIKVGIGVINPFTRHPVLSAMEFGALDKISKGRAILGMGASSKKWIEEEAGIPYTKPLTALNESITIIKKLFSKGEVKYNGKVFRTGNLKLSFSPFRKDIPIFLGVKGPKGLRMATKISNGVLLSMMTSKDYIEYVKKQIFCESSLAENNKKFTIAAYIIVNISKDRKKAREQVKPLISKYIGIYGSHPIVTSSGLTEEDILPFVNASINEKDASYLVEDKFVDKFAIAGEENECKEKIISLIKSGVNYPIITEIPGVPLDYTMEIISKYFLKSNKEG